MPAKKSQHREIERKFLVRKLPDNLKRFRHTAIEQAYLMVGPKGLQVRLRKAGSQLSLTFKRNNGRYREEREVKLTAAQFRILWPATAKKRLSKTRYDVPFGGQVIEIDIYRGRHRGLVVAEVEFVDERSARSFQPPDWLGKDVTGNRRYSNVLLAS